MYVDESGDVGLNNSPTNHFILTGMVIHESRWSAYLDGLVAFRRRMRDKFGLPVRVEIHSSAMLNRGKFYGISRNDRLAIARHFVSEIAKMDDARIINVVVDKTGLDASYNVFEQSWTVLLQRFHNTLRRNNFPCSSGQIEYGVLIPDNTDNDKLRKLLRSRRRYSPTPHDQHYGAGFRNIQIDRIIEDPNFRSSDDSYFIQAVDLVAFLLRQRIVSNAYMRRKSVHSYFNKLAPIYCTHACRYNNEGIVWLPAS